MPGTIQLVFPARSLSAVFRSPSFPGLFERLSRVLLYAQASPFVVSCGPALIATMLSAQSPFLSIAGLDSMHHGVTKESSQSNPSARRLASLHTVDCAGTAKRARRKSMS
jgi:hypothetical protein